MALDRLQQLLSKGGLALPNLETLHTAMLAWLLERALHNHPLHSTPLYASAWKHQLDLTSSSLRRKIFSPSFRRKVLFSSCLLTAAFNSWKYIQKQAKLITATLIPTSKWGMIQTKNFFSFRRAFRFRSEHSLSLLLYLLLYIIYLLVEKWMEMDKWMEVQYNKSKNI
jgi:hypothetical protein